MTVTARFTCREEEEEEDGSTVDQRTRSTAIGGARVSPQKERDPHKSKSKSVADGRLLYRK
jgi:hypothetical protein